MVTDNDDESNGGLEPLEIETFIYPEEEFFDPVTGEPATGSPLPEPVPITVEIPISLPRPQPPAELPSPPPPPTLPVRPTGEFVTSVELALALADMIELTRRMIRDALEGLAGLGPGEGLVTQEAFNAVLRDQALREVARNDAVDAMFAAQADQLVTLESLIATTLSQIEDRRLAEIAEVEEVTGFSPMAIFAGLGDFMRDPVNYVLEKSRDQILEEISSGLNR